MKKNNRKSGILKREHLLQVSGGMDRPIVPDFLKPNNGLSGLDDKNIKFKVI